MRLTVTFTDKEVVELREVLNRAMNCWTPDLQPKWLQGVSDRVDVELGGLMSTRRMDVKGGVL